MEIVFDLNSGVKSMLPIAKQNKTPRNSSGVAIRTVPYTINHKVLWREQGGLRWTLMMTRIQLLINVGHQLSMVGVN